MLQMMCVVAFVLGATPTTGPAASGQTASKPAATQPSAAPPIAKYYSLMKYEFMKDTDGRLVLTTAAVREAVQQARQGAADEKKTVDDQIASMKENVRIQMESAKAAEAKAKGLDAQAQKHASRGRNRTDHRGPAGRLHDYYESPNYREQDAAEKLRNQAAEARQQADQARGEVRRLNNEIAVSQRQANYLAGVASPASLLFPPKQFWAGLPDDQQDLLSRVGIARDEFTALAVHTHGSEAAFVARAQSIEKTARGRDELVTAMRAEFEDR